MKLSEGHSARGKGSKLPQRHRIPATHPMRQPEEGLLGSAQGLRAAVEHSEKALRFCNYCKEWKEADGSQASQQPPTPEKNSGRKRCLPLKELKGLPLTLCFSLCLSQPPMLASASGVLGSLEHCTALRSYSTLNANTLSTGLQVRNSLSPSLTCSLMSLFVCVSIYGA